MTGAWRCLAEAVGQYGAGLGVRDLKLTPDVFPSCFTSAVGEGEELISPCLPPGFKSEWQHAEIVYKIKGQKAGIVIYHSFYLGQHAISRVNDTLSASCRDTGFSVYHLIWLLLMCF